MDGEAKEQDECECTPRDDEEEKVTCTYIMQEGWQDNDYMCAHTGAGINKYPRRKFSSGAGYTRVYIDIIYSLYIHTRARVESSLNIVRLPMGT